MPYRIGYLIWAVAYARTWFRVWRDNRISFPLDRLMEERQANENFFIDLKFGKHRKRNDV